MELTRFNQEANQPSGNNNQSSKRATETPLVVTTTTTHLVKFECLDKIESLNLGAYPLFLLLLPSSFPLSVVLVRSHNSLTERYTLINK